jgi:hypothetical protein
MASFNVTYSGNVSVKPLNFTLDNCDAQYSKLHVLRSLSYYWPTYNRAAVWTQSGELVGEFESVVTVREVTR